MASPSRSRRPGLIILIIIAFIVVLSLPAVIIVLTRGPGTAQTQANITATAQSQLNATTAAQAQTNTTATAIAVQATAQAQATATSVAQAQLNATATATAVQAILSQIICKYMYWQTGVNTDKPLMNFGVPQGCVLVLDSFAGSLNGVTFSNGGVVTLSPVPWSNGGVMAFPPGVYSGDIFNGEYAIVPEKDNPNPEQVFCNRVQQLVTNGYAFSNAQPLPEWGLPPGSQIVVQHHC